LFEIKVVSYTGSFLVIFLFIDGLWHQLIHLL
jgi:hypothetical protein